MIILLTDAALDEDRPTMVAEIGITPGSPSWLRLACRAKVLAALTLVWLGIERAVGVVAGVLAGSIALVAFGLDSAIEGLASIIVIWRFTGTRTILGSPDDLLFKIVR
jgi:hypothetical protein